MCIIQPKLGGGLDCGSDYKAPAIMEHATDHV